jgi:predicted outer membrane protein
MLRKVLLASSVVALTGSMSLFADPKIQPDPVGPNEPVVAARKVAEDTKRTDRTDRSPREDQAQTKEANWSWKNPDHALASCVALANQEEIALGELGSQKAHNEEVKKFAQMLVQDHQEFLGKLKEFAPEASSSGFLNSDKARTAARSGAVPATKAGARTVEQAVATDGANDSAKIETTAGKEAGAKSGDAHHHHGRHLQIEREVAQQCLMMSKEKLNSETGEKFDKCFIGQQIGMHSAMKAKLIVYQRHASSELAQVLAAGQKKTEEHLAKAEEIMKTLDHGTTTASTK